MITLLWAPSGSSCTYSTHHTSLTFLPTFYTTVVHLTLCSAGWKSMGATHNGSSICLTVEGTATSGHDQKRMHNRYGLQLNGFQMYPNVSTWVTLQGYNLGGKCALLKVAILKISVLVDLATPLLMLGTADAVQYYVPRILRVANTHLVARDKQEDNKCICLVFQYSVSFSHVTNNFDLIPSFLHSTGLRVTLLRGCRSPAISYLTVNSSRWLLLLLHLLPATFKADPLTEMTIVTVSWLIALNASDEIFEFLVAWWSKSQMKGCCLAQSVEHPTHVQRLSPWT